VEVGFDDSICLNLALFFFNRTNLALFGTAVERDAEKFRRMETVRKRPIQADGWRPEAAVVGE
jgi:hypothetical protein